MGDKHKSRFELFIQAPVWLLVLLFVIVTAIVVLTALHDAGVI